MHMVSKPIGFLLLLIAHWPCHEAKDTPATPVSATPKAEEDDVGEQMDGYLKKHHDAHTLTAVAVCFVIGYLVRMITHSLPKNMARIGQLLDRNGDGKISDQEMEALEKQLLFARKAQLQEIPRTIHFHEKRIKKFKVLCVIWTIIQALLGHYTASIYGFGNVVFLVLGISTLPLLYLILKIVLTKKMIRNLERLLATVQEFIKKDGQEFVSRAEASEMNDARATDAALRKQTYGAKKT